ncbi:cystathionine beta-lyase [Neorhizobium galegae]|uniref:MalY/PatB family protein n=1 Tax=Neorhizobium galegae TaxID=399 RepID=UPI001AE5026B|nr:MalY/PatB family protein [Neorhizobium galegae]MBP2550952.1 cystathionine beta-lyase [Neorhizobium galegae]
MTSFDFDTVIPRKGTDAKKWAAYPADVLPMWVADMDFAAPPSVIEALRARVEHGVFGYGLPQDAFRQQIVDDMQAKYGWTISPDDIVFLPGVEPGFNMALKSETKPGDGLLIQTPVYHPILTAHRNWGLKSIEAPLVATDNGYEMDAEQLDAAMARSRAFLLCNPHNPTGKVLTREDLSAIAASAIRHDVLVIADEIHCELLFDGRRHIPIASLSPEIAERTITLMSASKTYNIAGLKTAFAIVTNAALRTRFNASRLGLVDSVNVLGLEASRVAYATAGPWRDALLTYLQGNRDYLQAEIARRFPAIRIVPAESTYLAWLDCAALDLPEAPQSFFLTHGRVAFSAGADFGSAYGKYLRVNFGCPRALLEEGLDRMERALSSFAASAR